MVRNYTSSDMLRAYFLGMIVGAAVVAGLWAVLS